MEVICLWEHPERKDWDFFPAMRISTRGKVCEGKFKPSQQPAVVFSRRLSFLFLHLFSKYLLNFYYGSDTVLGTGIRQSTEESSMSYWSLQSSKSLHLNDKQDKLCYRYQSMFSGETELITHMYICVYKEIHMYLTEI